MDQEIDQLIERTARLLDIVQRLSQENASLRGQLASALEAQAALQARMLEARARVESALSRLPALETEES